MECRTSVVSVRSTSARVGLQAGLPGPAHPPKIGVKESRLKIPLRRFYPKSSKTIISELAVGFKKFGGGPKTDVPRAR